MKEQIKQALDFRKPSRVIIVAAVVLATVLSVGLAINRTHEPVSLDNDEQFSSFQQLSLDDIHALAAKGAALVYTDLPFLRPSLLSSIMGGYNPTLYNVEGGYRLLVVFNDTMNPENGILSIQFERIWDNGGSGIDIRYNDVDEFIKANPSNPAIIGEEAASIARAYSGKAVTLIDTDWWEFADEFPHHCKDPAKQALRESLETIDQTCELFIDADGAFIAVGRRNGGMYTYDSGVWRVAERSI